MYDLPEDVDWSFLIGGELLQVCYGEYQTQLNFHGDVNISIEGDIEHRAGPLVVGRSDARRQDVTSLLQLLGASVKRVEVEAKNTLLLTFDNGHALKILSDDRPYESYSISAPGEQTIIV